MDQTFVLDLDCAPRHFLMEPDYDKDDDDGDHHGYVLIILTVRIIPIN